MNQAKSSAEARGRFTPRDWILLIGSSLAALWACVVASTGHSGTVVVSTLAALGLLLAPLGGERAAGPASWRRMVSVGASVVVLLVPLGLDRADISAGWPLWASIALVAIACGLRLAAALSRGQGGRGAGA